MNLQAIWNEKIYPNWLHRDRPAGQRFLGSISIGKADSDEIIQVVQARLRRIGNITFNRLEDALWDSQQSWIKVLTFALSEYAYYESASHKRLYQGVCEKWGLSHSQGAEQAFRQVIDQGLQCLGLIESRSGFRYVSSLWLQSGIPKSSLPHFAQLVRDISDEYGWWEISHAESADLAQLLLETCQTRYPQLRILKNFLETSCDEEEGAEPISGELLQGIAIVAQELGRRDQSPEVLRDRHQREQLLQNYSLPSNFFLRDWDNLIQILSPKERAYTGRSRIIGHRKQPLSLLLDVVDTMDIQLYLPEQTLWKTQWRNLRGTYCHIPEQGWEGTFPQSDGLVIQELTQTVTTACPAWNWQLKSHTGHSLIEWHCPGIAESLPILIFDAWSGEQLAPHGLRGQSEIIIFCAKGTKLDLDDGIEVLDSWVPCSIPGWRGQHLQLAADTANLTIGFGTSQQTISWNSHASEQPVLRGLQIKSKRPTYLEVPKIWHPPILLGKTWNIQVEDLDQRQVLTAPDAAVPLPSADTWQAIALTTWIKQPGTYSVRLWNPGEYWTEKFKLQSSSEPLDITEPRLVEVQNRCATTAALPIQSESTLQFWLEDITLQGLWPLEEVSFSLSNGNKVHDYRRQATAGGCLSLNLAALRDTLPESNRYALSYQQSGENSQILLKTANYVSALSWTWSEQALHLSGLAPDETYTLTLWNLLLPQQQSVQQKISVSDGGQTTISLPVDFGIFHVQIQSALHSKKSLGWWSSIKTQQNLILPDEIDGSLFEYCMNIIENSSVEVFCEEILPLDLDISCNQLRQGAASLINAPCHLPPWLDCVILKQKLEALLPQKAALPISETSSGNPPVLEKQIYQLVFDPCSSQLRKAFMKKIKADLKKRGLDMSIFIHYDKIVKELIRLELQDSSHSSVLNALVLSIAESLHMSVKLVQWSQKHA